MDPAPPRLSNGQRVLYAFVEDSEKGPVLVTGHGLPIGLLIDLTAQASMMFLAQWRATIEKLTAKKDPAVLVGLDGGKIA